LKRWRDWPWAAKLSFLFVTLAIAPLAVTALLNGAAARSELISTTWEHNLQRARSTAAAIDNHLDRVLSDLQVIALAPGTVRYLTGNPSPELRSDVEAALLLMRETHGFESVSLVDPSGTVVLSTDPRLNGDSVIASRYFLEAVAGNSMIHEPRYDPERGGVYLHASVPIRHPDGPIVGVAVGRVPLSSLDRMLRTDTGFAGRGEFGILWDSQGIRLSHPTQPGLQLRPFEPLSADAGDRLVAESRYGPQTRRLLRVDNPLPGIVERSRWLLYEPGLDPHLRVETPAGPIYAALAPLRGQRWVYGIFSPESAILAAVRQETRRAVLVVLLTAVGAVAAGLAAARWAVRPLRRVGQTANAIAAGDMSHRVGLRQADELGQLAAAFDAMADALAVKDSELRGYADRLEQRVEEQTAELRELVSREQQARHRAEEANRLKDEFLSTVSHELRTPLNAILGWTWILLGDRLDPEGARRAVQTIERNARAQSQIIDDLLDVSRIVTGKLRLKMRPVALEGIVEAAVESVRPAAEAKSIQMETRSGPLPDGSELRGDPARLQQVVWNLLSNAVKFTPPGGRVEVAVDEEGDQARIRVSDTGIGIAPGFLPYVFDRFRQADSSTTRTYGGLGLGLSIVRNLVELHGGTIDVESRGEGQGAAFTVRLPLSPAPRAVEPPQEVRAEPGPPRLSGLRVLLVDDEPDALEVVSSALEELGAQVTAVASAAEAMAALRRTRADVLVADIGMPGEDGYSLIRKIRELGGELGGLPAIALTAYAGDGDRRRALEAGFQVHLAKPIEPRLLAETVSTVFKGVTPS
jgi:signal transduction histidine kinase